MANDIQNCSELENQTTTLEQIWEKQKSETKEKYWKYIKIKYWWRFNIKVNFIIKI